jgi:hypothetical protein
VLSEQRLPVEVLDLPNTRVLLKKNGEEVASTTGAAVHDIRLSLLPIPCSMRLLL